MTDAPVVVIGTGIVGLCCASYLQREGRSVVVVDPGAPGEGASLGNAGCFNGSSIVPVSMPGTLRQVPRWLLDPEGPLFIRWRYLPTLLPWLYRFVRAGQADKVRAQARALRALLGPSLESLVPLVKAAGAEDLVHRVGHLVVYRSEAGFDKDGAGMRLRAENGVAIEELSTDELRQLEPALSRDYVRGRLIGENGHTSDPLGLARRLAETLVRNGGRIVRERAVGFEAADGRVSVVRTEGGRHEATDVVVAAGAWSKPLAAALGDAVPLDTERGYHVMIRDPEVSPRTPTMAADGKFVATPMADGLRIAGTVEFAGLDAPPDWRRARNLLRQGQAMYPGLAREIQDERLSMWMGFRPSLPDSLPVIGPARRFANAYYAFGHGHVGLTAAAMTGRVIAALIGDKAPLLDPSPFRVARFTE